jgi:hypothetical protein
MDFEYGGEALPREMVQGCEHHFLEAQAQMAPDWDCFLGGHRCGLVHLVDSRMDVSGGKTCLSDCEMTRPKKNVEWQSAP